MNAYITPEEALGWAVILLVFIFAAWISINCQERRIK